MKLDQSMLGKKFTRRSWLKNEWMILEWVRGKYAGGVWENGDPYLNDYIDKVEDWELVEDPCQCKKREPGGIIECDKTLNFCAKCGEKIKWPEPKLPSERISERYRNNLQNCPIVPCDSTGILFYLQALTEFLDEQAGKLGT